MIYQASNVRVPLAAMVPGKRRALRREAARALGLKPAQLGDLRIVRRSVDARKKANVHYVVSFTFKLMGADPAQMRPAKGIAVQPYEPPAPPRIPDLAAAFQRSGAPRPIVVGAGPAGLFCALWLARAGLRPIVVERGQAVEDRAQTVEAFAHGAPLDPQSNIQFGEGGAGAFSDGKLTCGKTDPHIRHVLEAFVDAGAPADILVDAKPHIGTDRLPATVRGLREAIQAAGGEFRFSTQLMALRTAPAPSAHPFAATPSSSPSDVPRGTSMTAIAAHGEPSASLQAQQPKEGEGGSGAIPEDASRGTSSRGEGGYAEGEPQEKASGSGAPERRVCGAVLRDLRSGEEYEVAADAVVLAIGHSARDTVEMLLGEGAPMERKPFAVGVRIEHPQALIDRAQYGRAAGHPALPPADYKLNARTAAGRGVYTFCMCPGGTVVAAASEPGGVCTNGMSPYARDGCNANSALLVEVRPDDFEGDDVLAGIRFQRHLERAAYALAQTADQTVLSADAPQEALGSATQLADPGAAQLADSGAAHLADPGAAHLADPGVAAPPAGPEPLPFAAPAQTVGAFLAESAAADPVSHTPAEEDVSRETSVLTILNENNLERETVRSASERIVSRETPVATAGGEGAAGSMGAASNGGAAVSEGAVGSEDAAVGGLASGGGAVRATYPRGVVEAPLRQCLPPFVADALAEALPKLDRKLHGFADPEAVLTAVEARSSSPVRILRDPQSRQSTAIGGLFPAGEGAGYAGGIMSAATDGIRTAEAILAAFALEQTAATLDQAAAHLMAGHPAIFATDTVVGLGVAPGAAASPEALFALKGRPSGKPVAWLVGDPTALDELGARVPAYARRLAERFWPGPLTLVVRASDAVPAAFASADGTLGLRMPADPDALALIARTGPLAATSANPSGTRAPRTVHGVDPALMLAVGCTLVPTPAEEYVPRETSVRTIVTVNNSERAIVPNAVPEDVPRETVAEREVRKGSEESAERPPYGAGKPACGVDGADQPIWDAGVAGRPACGVVTGASGSASTVVDCTGDAPRVLREGTISQEAITAALA